MLRLIFVALVLGAGILCALRSRFAALLLYIWFALFRPQEWVWIDITSFRLSTVLGLLLVVPSMLTGVWPVIGHSISAAAILFLASCFVAQIGATDPVTGWQWIDFMVKLVVVSLFAIRLTSSAKRLQLLVGVVALSFAFHSARAGLASLLGGGLRFYEGTGGAFDDNNTYAVGCVMVIPLIVALAQSSRRATLRTGLYATAVLTAVTTISTYSRGGLLALAGSLFVFVLLQKRRFVLLVSGTVLFPLLLFAFLPSQYLDRMQTMRTYRDVEDSSALGRLHFWSVAIQIARDRPLGIGLWNFESTYDAYDDSNGQFGNRRAVHSSYLQVLTETGWLGGLCWVSLFFISFRRCFALRRAARAATNDEAQVAWTVANGVVASMCGFLIGGAFVSMAYNDLTWLTFAIVASLDRLASSLLSKPPAAALPAPPPPLVPRYVIRGQSA